MTVFEQSDYIGGRSTILYPWNDDPTVPAATTTSFTSDFFSSDSTAVPEEDPVELGASIFVGANKNLAKAAYLFGLKTVPHGTSGKEDEGGMAVWDGERFVFAESGNGWAGWDLAKLFWRYGRAPLKVNALVKETVASFLAIYQPAFASWGPFETWGDLGRTVNLTHAAALTGADLFRGKDVGARFVNELVSAGTQVNYGTPVSQLHGLGALVS